MIILNAKKIIIYSMTLFLIACGSDDFNTPRLNDDPTQEQPTHDSFAPEMNEAPGDWELTGTMFTLSPTERSQILAKYHYLDPNKLVPSKALEDTLIYFEQHNFNILNHNYVAVINFAQSSKEKRFYIIDMITGSVQTIHVAHGKGSDANYDGYADRFSNRSGTNASSLGFYTSAETYYGEHGLSLRLDGHSSTNSNARRRAIVIHGADYVKEESLIQGRSWGCPAVSFELKTQVVAMLKGGALINVVK